MSRRRRLGNGHSFGRDCCDEVWQVVDAKPAVDGVHELVDGDGGADDFGPGLDRALDSYRREEMRFERGGVECWRAGFADGD